MADRVKVTNLLPKEDVHTLQELARRGGRTMTETTRREIALENVVDDVVREDSKVLIRDRDNRDREVILRQCSGSTRQGGRGREGLDGKDRQERSTAPRFEKLIAYGSTP